MVASSPVQRKSPLRSGEQPQVRAICRPLQARGHVASNSQSLIAPMAIREFHPTIQRWFTDELGEPSELQTRGWPLIHAGGRDLPDPNRYLLRHVNADRPCADGQLSKHTRRGLRLRVDANLIATRKEV